MQTSSKINERDEIFGDSACQIDRDHQDHSAFGIEIDQNLRLIVKQNLYFLPLCESLLHEQFFVHHCVQALVVLFHCSAHARCADLSTGPGCQDSVNCIGRALRCQTERSNEAWD